VCRSSLPSIYGAAKALLNPLQWDEPFGLTMVEAMSCGTPVLALRRGSAAEVINQGVTGYAAESLEELEALLRDPGVISSMDRGACRRWVQEHFSEERMIDEYEKLFLDIAAESG
jgi:glycosyltransferase involved in cell wall biosynthesis